jgi:hypothetical protein
MGGGRTLKRSIGVLALVVALAAALTVPAATGKDARGPACTDFIGGDAFYSYNPETTSGTVTVEAQLAAPDCTGEYVLTIYSLTSGGEGQPLVRSVEPTGFDVHPETGNTLVLFSYTFTSSAPSDGVCVAVESFHRGHVADRSPDSGCFAVAANSPPASGFSG